MKLKYITKNNGYIIDRKLDTSEATINKNTFKTRGKMILSELLPQDEGVKKDIVEFAFDDMKEDIVNELKKKYHLKNNELINFYFEGKIENKSDNVIYAYIENEKFPLTETNFNLEFEAELKVTLKNFIRVHYEGLKYKLKS